MADPAPAPVADAPWPPPPPQEALSCPRCKQKVEVRPEVQTCACGLRFTLRAGPMLDSSLAPPAPDEHTKPIRVKSDGLFLRMAGELSPTFIALGALDPIIGHIQMDATKIAYKAIYTVAIWRRIPIASAISFVLLLLPFEVLSLVLLVSTREPAMLFFTAPMTLLTVWVGWQIFKVQAHWARVVAPKVSLRVRFDRPGRRRVRFHDELLRRCGIAPGPMP